MTNERELLEEVTTALGDLSFECFGVFGTTAPTVATYNRTFGVLEKARAALASQVVQEPVATNYADWQQRKGAPLTFFTSIAARYYAAAATRDDVSHHDAMRVALQAVEDAIVAPVAAGEPHTDGVETVDGGQTK